MPRAGLTTDVLAAAGADLADRDGFDKVTVSSVARHFDVAVASLYSHVKNGRDLETRIAVFSLTELADAASDAVAGRSEKEALAAFANSYRDYARAHPGRWAATQKTIDPTDDAVRAGRRHSDVMRAVLRGYHLDEVEQTHAIRLLGSTINGFVSLESTGSFDHTTPDSQASWDRILDALHAVLTNWPQERPS